MTEITGTEALARVKELVEDIDFTMLTTEDDDGHLVSRPMSTREMDAAGNIWFFTSEDTEKVDEARTHRDVGLSYCDAKGMRYVSVAGRARVVHDRALMEELYTPALDVWFADGLDTPGVELALATLLQRLPATGGGGKRDRDRTGTVAGITRRLRLSNEQAERVVWLVAHQHDLVDAPRLSIAKLKRVLAHPFAGDLLKLMRSDVHARRGEVTSLEFVERYLAETPADVLNPPPLVSGAVVPSGMRWATSSPGSNTSSQWLTEERRRRRTRRLPRPTYQGVRVPM